MLCLCRLRAFSVLQHCINRIHEKHPIDLVQCGTKCAGAIIRSARDAQNRLRFPEDRADVEYVHQLLLQPLPLGRYVVLCRIPCSLDGGSLEGQRIVGLSLFLRRIHHHGYSGLFFPQRAAYSAKMRWDSGHLPGCHHFNLQ